jgi:hypothetical protein
MALEDRRMRARSLQVECGRPLGATSKEQPEACAGGQRQHAANYNLLQKIRDKKYDHQHKRIFFHAPGRWLDPHRNEGVHPNEKAGVVPVLEGKASGASSIVRRGRAARQRFGDGGFPEFVLANTGANVYNYFQP